MASLSWVSHALQVTAKSFITRARQDTAVKKEDARLAVFLPSSVPTHGAPQPHLFLFLEGVIHEHPVVGVFHGVLLCYATRRGRRERERERGSVNHVLLHRSSSLFSRRGISPIRRAKEAPESAACRWRGRISGSSVVFVAFFSSLFFEKRRFAYPAGEERA